MKYKTFVKYGSEIRSTYHNRISDRDFIYYKKTCENGKLLTERYYNKYSPIMHVAYFSGVAETETEKDIIYYISKYDKHGNFGNDISGMPCKIWFDENFNIVAQSFIENGRWVNIEYEV